MIYSVRGKLVYAQGETAVVECAGVGYECRTSFSTLRSIAGKDEVLLYTHFSVRQDAVELFGFSTREELESFRMLIGVSGVGPKAALSILSSCTPSQFALAVATGDSSEFTKIKGVGAKTAQRIVLELKDKVAKGSKITVRGEASAVSPVMSDNISEAITALVVLGYSETEASSAIAKLDTSLPTEELIKKGLMSLAKFR